MPSNAIRLPLIVKQSNRDETVTKDARIINGMVEMMAENDYHVYKRPGYLTYSSVTAGAAQGAYNWESNIYTIVNGFMYRDGVLIGSGLDTAGGMYRFSSTLGSTHRLVFQNTGGSYYCTKIGGPTAITDVAYPPNQTPAIPIVPGLAYIDGYTAVMTRSAAIYTSGINDPTTWNILDNLIAQIQPDSGVCLMKQMVYVIAFKQYSTEVFYDAGNAAASPLGPVQGAKMDIGCRTASSVRELEGTLYWVSQSFTSGTSVHLMNGLKPEQISTEAIDRILHQADFTSVYSWATRINGHRLYSVTLVNNNLTLVYDLTSKYWYQWTDANGNCLPFVDATFTNDGQTLFQHATDGKLYKLEMTSYNDNGAAIPVDIYTPNFDGGTRKKKHLSRMDIVSDQISAGTLQIRFSDDDYQTWTAPRSVDLSNDIPNLIGCGTFRKRAFHFRHVADCPFRIQSVDLISQVGTL